MLNYCFKICVKIFSSFFFIYLKELLLRSKIWYRPREKLLFVSSENISSPCRFPVRHIHLFLNANQNAGDSSLSWWSLCLSLWKAMWACVLTCLCFTVFLLCISPLSTFHQGHLTTHKQPQTQITTDWLITAFIFLSVSQTVKRMKLSVLCQKCNPPPPPPHTNTHTRY